MNKRTVIPGRFQGLTKGHERLYNFAKQSNPNNQIVILICKGEPSDPSKNPFSLGLRKKLVKRAFPEAKVAVARNMYDYLKDPVLPFDNVCCGRDRQSAYKDLPKVTMPRNDVSSTKLRQALNKGDRTAFQAMVPQRLKDKWDLMLKQIQLAKLKDQVKDLHANNKPSFMGHIQHLQDILLSGKKGRKLFVKMVQKLLDKLQSGNLGGITQKFDGSPSILFGKHPEDGKFFVSLKNKKPFKSPDERQQMFGDRPKLLSKMNAVFQGLKDLNLQGIFGGEVMFAGDKNVQGDKANFSPNIIKYQVGKDDPMYSRNVGIIVYGRYDDDFNLSQSYENDISTLNGDNSTVLKSSLINNKKVQLGQAKDLICRMLQKINYRVDSIDQSFDYMWRKTRVLNLLKSYFNLQLKTDGGIFDLSKKMNTDRMLVDFVNYIGQVGKNKRQKQNLQSLLKNVNDFRMNIGFMLAAYRQALRVKQILMGLLKKTHEHWPRCFADGTQSGPEGYVVMDQATYKLVDKMGFTKRNLMMNQDKAKRLQKMVMQKFRKKVLRYKYFNQKVNNILRNSKKLLQSNNHKGLAMLQGLRIKFDKKNRYIKILQSYNKDKRLKFWGDINNTYQSKKRNITQVVKLAGIQTQFNKNHPIGLNALIMKNWVSNNQSVKPIYDKLNWFNKKFIQYIQGIFMSNNFIFNWQRTKLILRKAARQVRRDKKPTTAQNIMNQVYDKINDQGQLDSPSERMNKLKEAAKAYAQQVQQLSVKVNQMRNTDSKSNPGQKLLNKQQVRQVNKRLDQVRTNLKKVADSYEQLMVLTSSSTKGKFYINLMLLFLGNKKLSDIEQVLNEVPQYNRTTDGFGFDKLQKKRKQTTSTGGQRRQVTQKK